MSAPRSIEAQASCRVDLAGGTLDLWPLYLFHPGAVTVNYAVDILTRCRITPHGSSEIHFRSLDTGREDRFQNMNAVLRARSYQHAIAGYLCRFFFADRAGSKRGFLLETTSESPAGAGISGSSALMVATTAALARFTATKMSKEEIRVLAQNVEAQIIRVPTGCQDYYPALYGGVNAIELRADGIRRNAVDIPCEEINARFLLVYTGAPRQSGINNWEVFKTHLNGEKRVFKNFEQIGAIARKMRSALEGGDWTEVSRLLHEEWKLRKTNAPGITTPLIDRLVKEASKQGARAAKVCGAGGGGCVVFFVEPEARIRVAQTIMESGGRVLPSQVAQAGLKVAGAARA